MQNFYILGAKEDYRKAEVKVNVNSNMIISLRHEHNHNYLRHRPLILLISEHDELI